MYRGQRAFPLISFSRAKAQKSFLGSAIIYILQTLHLTFVSFMNLDQYMIEAVTELRNEEFCGSRSLSFFLFRCAMYNHVSVVQFLVDHVSIKKHNLFKT